MIFWILIALMALVAIAVFGSMLEEGEGFWFSFGSGLLAILISSIVAMVIFTVTFGIFVAGFRAPPTGTYTSHWSNDLTALDTGSATEGRFYFLGGGYIDGKRVLNYVDKHDGAFRIKEVDADISRIFESSGKPHLEAAHADFSWWWLAPFPLDNSYAYDFHIPKGSVLSNYTITNK